MCFCIFQGGIVVVEVWDDDGGQIVGVFYDYVDKYIFIIVCDVDLDVKFVMQEFKKLCGVRLCMIVIVILYCGVNYFVLDCYMYCVLCNDSFGYYQCNFIVG